MASVIPAITRISPKVIRILGCNPSKTTMQGTNTYIIGTGKRRILIDTGDEDVPQYINHLRSVLKFEGIDIAHIFLTHWHADHVGGLQDILEELPEFTENCEVWKYPRYEDDKIHHDLQYLKDGQEFSVEGATIRVLHTPGHTSDHVAFHLVEDNVIFSGDCVLGEGEATFEHLDDYLDSLRSILMVQPDVICPGHGNVVYIPLIIPKFFRKMSMAILAIPEVTKISSNVIRVLGCNPGPMTLQGTNTYIVGTGKRRILIDTGEPDIPKYIKELSQILNTENIDLSHIFLTHWHNDHVGGLKNILNELPKFTSSCQIWKFPHNDDSKLPQKPNYFTNGQEVSVEGATLRVIHTPGHTTDHVIFHLLEDNIVFSGDCILGEGTAVFEDLHDYMISLRAILNLQPALIYPGHGNIINDPIDRIQYYIDHRQQREQQIMEILKNNSKECFSENDLVKKIYTGLSEKLIKAAEYNVNHHLQKLLKDGNVVKKKELWQYKQ